MDHLSDTVSILFTCILRFLLPLFFDGYIFLTFSEILCWLVVARGSGGCTGSSEILDVDSTIVVAFCLTGGLGSAGFGWDFCLSCCCTGGCWFGDCCRIDLDTGSCGC